MTFQTGGVITLNVVGADIMDWNTGVEAVSAHVWKLMFSHVNHTHFWDSRDVDLMGKCDVQGSSILLAMLVTILMSGHFQICLWVVWDQEMLGFQIHSSLPFVLERVRAPIPQLQKLV